MHENRQFVVFDVSELDKIDFAEVLETSTDTVRTSTDGTKTFVKWEDGPAVPSSVQSLVTKSPYLTHEEILAMLASSEWTIPNQPE